MRGAQRSFPWASARADGHFGCAACVAQVFEELEKSRLLNKKLADDLAYIWPIFSIYSHISIYLAYT